MELSGEPVVVLAEVGFALRLRDLFLLWRAGFLPLTVSVDSTTISSNACPNAAEKKIIYKNIKISIVRFLVENMLHSRLFSIKFLTS